MEERKAQYTRTRTAKRKAEHDALIELAKTDEEAAKKLAEMRKYQSDATMKSRQKMKTDAESRDLDAIMRYEAYLAKRREDYHKRKQNKEEKRPIGHWGRLHKAYLKDHHPTRYNILILDGTLWTYLADLNEQAQSRLEVIIEQMQNAEGVTEAMKANNPMLWVQSMNSIRNRASDRSTLWRLSQTLCKPPAWCRIEAQHRRF